MVSSKRSRRGGRVEAAAAAALYQTALVCILAAAGQRHGAAAAPSASYTQNDPAQQRESSLPHIKEPVVCNASLEVGERSDGGQHVTVSAPESCNCTEVELSVLQSYGIPCAPNPDGPQRCSWMTAHATVTDTSKASFLVSVGGKFRPRIRCHPPWLAKESSRPGAASLFVGDPIILPGIDLASWNLSLAASTRDDDLIVRVVRQMDASDTDFYFPELMVALLRPPGQGEYRPRIVDYRKVAFSPGEQGVPVNFTGAALFDGCRVDVKPANSWVCQGANDGCQKRYAMVQDLLKLSEEARANQGIKA